MKIRPKIPIFQEGGTPSTVTWTNPDYNWFIRSGLGILEGTYNMLKPLHDKWKLSGKLEDYLAYKDVVDALNNDLYRYYQPGYMTYTENNNQLFSNPLVGQWLLIVKDKYPYINKAIGNSFNHQYYIHSSNPLSGDNPKKGWVVDNYWAGITHDRTPWGYTFDLNDPDYLEWKEKFNEIGIDYRTNPEWGNNEVLYGFLRDPDDTRLNLKHLDPISIKKPSDELKIDSKLEVPSEIYLNEIDARRRKDKNFDWNKIRGSLLKSIPGIIEGVRLVGNHIANEKIYDEALKGIRPDLMQSYNTYRQVVGDEATKQAYYRRAIQGLTRAARPFTSDADKQMAYLFEAKRVGDELKAQGDLADNLRIRETAELSSQHLDANRQRATEVANANNKAINYANSLKHNLLALKHAALWSSVDNYLQGLANEYKANNERNKLWDLLAWLLLREGEVENDLQLTNLRKLFDIAAAKPLNLKLDNFGLKVVNYDSDEIKGLVQKIKNRNRELQFETLLQRRILFGKSGTKVTVKKKEKNDLLYKSTRDVVEHFRRMSKMSSDAQNRKRIKIDKLAPHPKGTKKYQQGGLAPFLVYKPTILGGETTTTTQTDSSSSKSSKSGSSTDLEIDLLKDLFKNLEVEGLPSDTNIIYSSMMELMNRRKLFGNSLSSSDIESMYIHLLEKINAIKYNKAQFDKISEIVHNKNADSEIAIDNLGRIAVQNLENKEVEYKRLEDLEKGKYVPLTNRLLLDLRAISPNMAFDSGLAFQTAANATSMLEIAKFLKDQLPSIESSESVIEGYTKRESNNIKEGIRQLLYDAPEGDYKYTITNKNNSEQIKSALEYLKNVLPNNMKNYLEIKSGGRNPDKLIVDLLSSKFESTLKTEFLAVTDKASGKDSVDKISSNPLLSMQREIGGTPINYSVITRDSNTRMSVNGTHYNALPKIKGDMSINDMLNTSGINGIVINKRGITFGDQLLKPEDLSQIMYSDDGGGTIVTLPCKIVNGVKQINLDVKDLYEKAELYALQFSLDRTSPLFVKALGEGLKLQHLDSLLDSNGLPNKNMFAQFLIVEAYTTDKVNFEKDSLYVEKVQNPDEYLELRMIKALSTDKKKPDYSIDIKDHWGLFEGFYDDIYRGNIFIPLTNNPNAAINSWGGSVNVTLSTELEELYQNANKSSKFNNNNSL